MTQTCKVPITIKDCVKVDLGLLFGGRNLIESFSYNVRLFS